MGLVPAYVYILRCRDGRYYYGSTGDLSRRLAEHREGLSRWTASRRPVELVYYEARETLAQARQRELSFKNGRTRRKTLERMIADFPQERLLPFA
jgi:putative endonuclease